LAENKQNTLVRSREWNSPTEYQNKILEFQALMKFMKKSKNQIETRNNSVRIKDPRFLKLIK